MPPLPLSLLLRILPRSPRFLIPCRRARNRALVISVSWMDSRGAFVPRTRKKKKKKVIRVHAHASGLLRAASRCWQTHLPLQPACTRACYVHAARLQITDAHTWMREQTDIELRKLAGLGVGWGLLPTDATRRIILQLENANSAPAWKFTSRPHNASDCYHRRADNYLDFPTIFTSLPPLFTFFFQRVFFHPHPRSRGYLFSTFFFSLSQKVFRCRWCNGCFGNWRLKLTSDAIIKFREDLLS